MLRLNLANLSSGQKRQLSKVEIRNQLRNGNFQLSDNIIRISKKRFQICDSRNNERNDKIQRFIKGNKVSVPYTFRLLFQMQEEICDHLLNQAERTKITRSRNKLRKKWLDGILTVAKKSALTFEENSKTKKST